MYSEINPTDIEKAASSGSIEKDLDSPIGLSSSNLDGVGNKQENTSDSVLPEDELNRPLSKPESLEDNGLSIDERTEIQSRTGWSDTVVDNIKSVEEAEIYVNADLKEVNGNLERNDIDWSATVPQDRIDRMRSLYGDAVADKWAGKTNMDLIKEGKAPYGPDGERINLHHIGQKSDSPLAELTNTEHKQYDGILHDKTKSSEIERPVFKAERQQYWQSRYDSLQQS